MKHTSCISALVLVVCAPLVAHAVPYAVIAVKSDRPDDTTFVEFAEVKEPHPHPPSDLVRIDPDGSETVLVSGNGVDALFDPRLDPAGEWLYYVRIPRTAERNGQRHKTPYAGADIYRRRMSDGAIEQITSQDYDNPPEWFADFAGGTAKHGYGVLNMGPCPLPDGSMVFTSSRDRLQPTKLFTFPCLQLYLWRPDGTIERIGVMSQGSALHPVLTKSGKLIFSSYEPMGHKDRRVWGGWEIDPDGTDWGPVISAFETRIAWHFHSQRTSGEVIYIAYYNQNNNGFGALYGLNEPPTHKPFHSAVEAENPLLPNGLNYFAGWQPLNFRMSTTPQGMRSLTPWATMADTASGQIDGEWVGKVTHPCGAPGNHVLLTYTTGPANNLNRPTATPRYHMSIRAITGDTSEHPSDLEIVAASPNHNYTQPIPLSTWQEIYNQPAVQLPYEVDHTKNYGTIVSGDATHGQYFPHQASNQGWDGGGDRTDAKYFTVLTMRPNEAQIYGQDLAGRSFSSGTSGWKAIGSERLALLGEVPLESDNSVKVHVPADTPVTFQLRDSRHNVITMAQTWHQFRPGEVRDCGGCHNHSGQPVPFTGTLASLTAGTDLTTATPRRVEWHRDVLPILEAHCYDCHDPVVENREAGMEENFSLDLDGALSKSIGYASGTATLCKVLSGNMMPPPDRAQPTEAEKMIVYEWENLGLLRATDDSGAAFHVIDRSLPGEGPGDGPPAPPDPDCPPLPDVAPQLQAIRDAVDSIEQALTEE